MNLGAAADRAEDGVELDAAGHQRAGAIRLRSGHFADHIDERADRQRIPLHFRALRVRHLLVLARVAHHVEGAEESNRRTVAWIEKELAPLLIR